MDRAEIFLSVLMNYLINIRLIKKHVLSNKHKLCLIYFFTATRQSFL